ncbi:MAG TPA: hypothetical protein ENN29_11245, partial [Candidatus Hydrogenedentes bacterium]|nr:hypothetical protein [Candidatus Hydrogenedentota bacterium]
MAQTCGRSETGAPAHESGALSINDEKARPPVPAPVFRTYFSLASVALGICVIAAYAGAHEPLPDWSECPVANSPDARFAPLPIFVQT